MNKGNTTAGRPLRRTERGLTEEQALEVIRGTDHAFLATADCDGAPYGIPVTPVLEGRSLYFHCSAAPGGRKTDNMEMNQRVCLCFMGKARTVPELYTVDFASAVVEGRAARVPAPEEKARAFVALLRRHAPHNSAARNAVQFANRLHLTEVWRVDIERITGKARAAQRWVPGVTLREDAEMPVQPWLRDAPK